MEKYYVSGCKGQDDDIVTCDDEDAHFWTIYQRDSMGLSQGLVDFTFREDAEAAMKVYVERDALQQKLDAVLAEGIELRKFIRDSCYAYNGDGSDISDAYTPAEESPLFPKSAATDAILNAVRAEGVRHVRKQMIECPFEDIGTAIDYCDEFIESVTDADKVGSDD